MRTANELNTLQIDFRAGDSLSPSRTRLIQIGMPQVK